MGDKENRALSQPTLIRKIQAASAALLFPGVVFVMVPNAIFLANLDEIPFQQDVVEVAVYAFLLGFGFLLPISLGSCYWKTPDRLIRVFHLLAIYVIFAGLAGHFLGDASLPLSALIPLDLFALLVSGFVVFRMDHSKLVAVISIVTPVMLAVSIASILDASWAQGGSPAKPPNAIATASKKLSQAVGSPGDKDPPGNVYHIIFDGYQREVYPYLAEKESTLGSLPFTFYENFRSNASHTWLSNGILFSGNFPPLDMEKPSFKKPSRTTGLLADLAKNGVGVHIFSSSTYYCLPFVKTCLPKAHYQQELRQERIYQTAFYDLWFLNVIPYSVRNSVQRTVGFDVSKNQDTWDYGFSISKFLSRSKLTKRKGPGFSDKPFFSVAQYRDFLRTEASRPETGQYIFVHSILPHRPMVMDHNCVFHGLTKRQKRKQHFQGYLQQSRCAMKLLLELVEELKRLGRFENSLIIVHSDHGGFINMPETRVLNKLLKNQYRTRFIRSKDNGATWPSGNVERRASALLLVKFPAQTEARKSEARTQTIDIAPTILKHFQIETAGYQGIPLQSAENPLSRTQQFFVVGRTPKESQHYLFRYEFQGKEWLFLDKTGYSH